MNYSLNVRPKIKNLLEESIRDNTYYFMKNLFISIFLHTFCLICVRESRTPKMLSKHLAGNATYVVLQWILQWDTRAKCILKTMTTMYSLHQQINVFTFPKKVSKYLQYQDTVYNTNSQTISRFFKPGLTR